MYLISLKESLLVSIMVSLKMNKSIEKHLLYIHRVSMSDDSNNPNPVALSPDKASLKKLSLT